MWRQSSVNAAPRPVIEQGLMSPSCFWEGQHCKVLMRRMHFSFWDEQSLKVRCLHFLSGFVNEHRWDPTVMRQRQASGWEEIIRLTREEAENLCSGYFKHEKSGKVFCCQSVVYGPRLLWSPICGSILKSGLRWQDGEGERGMWGLDKKETEIMMGEERLQHNEYFKLVLSTQQCSHHRSLSLVTTCQFIYMWIYLFSRHCCCSRFIMQWHKYTRIC